METLFFANLEGELNFHENKPVRPTTFDITGLDPGSEVETCHCIQQLTILIPCETSELLRVWYPAVLMTFILIVLQIWSAKYFL